MEKEFVPYELAVKLKELGFDEPTIAGYRDYNGIKLMTRVKDNTYPLVNNSGFGKYCHQNKHIVKAPLWQQAFDWFRENHNLHCILHKSFDGYFIDIIRISDFSSELYERQLPYHEARQACLEKLIELITANT